MKKILDADKKMSIKRFYVKPFTISVDCPLCHGRHDIEYDMLSYPCIGLDDTFGYECPVKCDEWDDAPDDAKPETEFEIPFKIISINVEIEISEMKIEQENRQAG
jgi:hypothetical protein